MEINVGKMDRIIRLVVGMVIVGIGTYYQSYWGWLAVIPLGTAAMSWCPVYKLLGISSCEKSSGARNLGSV